MEGKKERERSIALWLFLFFKGLCLSYIAVALKVDFFLFLLLGLNISRLGSLDWFESVKSQISQGESVLCLFFSFFSPFRAVVFKMQMRVPLLPATWLLFSQRIGRIFWWCRHATVRLLRGFSVATHTILDVQRQQNVSMKIKRLFPQVPQSLSTGSFSFCLFFWAIAIRPPFQESFNTHHLTKRQSCHFICTSEATLVHLCIKFYVRVVPAGECAACT